MKLKIVQPEVERKEEDEIELFLEYDENDDVCLMSRNSHGVKRREVKIDCEGDMIVKISSFKSEKFTLHQSNLKSVYLF